MKKLILIAAVAILAMSCNSTKYTIKGSIDGLTGPVMLMNPADNSGIATTDATELGAFSFEGEVEKPQLVVMSAQGIGLNTIMILEPGDIVVAVDTVKGLTITGTKLNDRLAAVNSSVYDLRTNPEATQDDLKNLLIEQTKLNSDNVLGVFFFLNIYSGLTTEEAEQMVVGFSPELQETEEIVSVKEEIAKAKRTSVGEQFVPVSELDAQGEAIALADVVAKNKYTLVDFWASWCTPCMMEVPFLVEAYATYNKAGFEIYGISVDQDKAAWTKAVEDNKMNWIQVNGTDAANEYAVQTIPTNYLIDQSGKIVAKNLRGDEVVEKLKELMQ